MAINDLYTDGVAAGWKVRDASSFTSNQTLEADVVIVGSGAGGGTAAEFLSGAGLKVLMLEEGALYTATHFKDMDEARAFGQLYQEGGGRASADGAVSILQGRAVGGTTTVNWTTSIRTPDATLKHWAEVYGLKDSSPEAMAPWYQKAEERLGIAPWAAEPNANNGVLKRGCQALGWHWKAIPRNVRGCWNLGYCGTGCPTNAKQSMLVTTIPQALSQGMELVHHLRAERLRFENGRVAGISAVALDPAAMKPTGITVEIRARHYVLAGGAINTPGLLLRSNAPDPHQRIGQRTCIHPVALSLARFAEPINGFHGAPQSVYSDHFLWPEGKAGYKLEVPPMQPMLTSIVFGSFGERLAADMAALPHTQETLALLRDGFDERSPGGQVRLAGGYPRLHYDFDDYLWDGFKRALLSMAELQFAAGAEEVRPAHLDARRYGSWSYARDAIADLPYRKLRQSIFTAHLMGGCAMGEDPKTTVINSEGRYHGVDNLSVFDGSMFPTSIGANPQLSIYGFIGRNATKLAETLKPA
jgi:choline dehydrogenase-like flavoprotein